MKKNRIKTLAGDGVTIEMSPYYRRRLIFRHKDERAGVSRSLVRRPFVRAVLVDFKRRKDHTHAHLHLAGDLGGSKVPQQHGPWTAIWVVRPEADPHRAGPRWRRLSTLAPEREGSSSRLIGVECRAK